MYILVNKGGILGRQSKLFPIHPNISKLLGRIGRHESALLSTFRYRRPNGRSGRTVRLLSQQYKVSREEGNGGSESSPFSKHMSSSNDEGSSGRD